MHETHIFFAPEHSILRLYFSRADYAVQEAESGEPIRNSRCTSDQVSVLSYFCSGQRSDGVQMRVFVGVPRGVWRASVAVSSAP